MSTAMEHLIDAALHEPLTATSYYVNRRLRALFPARALLQGDNGMFILEEYARAGHCTLAERPTPLGQHLSYWRGAGKAPLYRAHQTWYEVTWQGERLDTLIMHWNDNMSASYHYFILADRAEVAENFLVAVCDWSMELRDEVLVFEGGNWHKDPELFRAIQSATLDNLVLRGRLKEDIYADLTSFFAGRATYESYGVPWKRGILLVGPPGNGKTHAVKALVNALGQPCLYVKSFHTPMPDEFSIRLVFDRARATTPCILVLEDLDSLITPTNRSFFLNELDGFAGNAGILTLATTNHPERLDPAIVDRPSRFDRKYPFDLPTVEERQTYICQWNETLKPALRLADTTAVEIAALTEGFSFAYLKELFISATMRWIAMAQAGAMDDIMREQVGILHEQMASSIFLSPVHDPAAEGAAQMSQMAMMHRARMGFHGHPGVYAESDERNIPL